MKRQIAYFLVIFIGFLALLGHFINYSPLNNFIDNDATQWFDIISGFAAYLGVINLLQLNINKVTNSLNKKLKLSKRREIEIVDLLNKYKRKNKLSAEFLGRGGAWLDTGSIKDFYDTSAFVSALEKRQGLKIACLEEIALNNKWINKKNISRAIKFYGKCGYSQYLSSFIKKS